VRTERGRAAELFELFEELASKGVTRGAARGATSGDAARISGNVNGSSPTTVKPAAVGAAEVAVLFSDGRGRGMRVTNALSAALAL